jgi:hypothetical protein
MPEVERRYNSQASAEFHARDRGHVLGFFDGLDLLGPGLVNLSRGWRGTSAGPRAEPDVAGYCGVARKP